MSRQRKTEAVMVSLEPGLRKIVDLALEKHGISASAYFRKLAIEDLKTEGLLTNDMLLQITEG